MKLRNNGNAPKFTVVLTHKDTGEELLFPGMLSKYMAKNAQIRLLARYGENYIGNFRLQREEDKAAH